MGRIAVGLDRAVHRREGGESKQVGTFEPLSVAD